MLYSIDNSDVLLLLSTLAETADSWRSAAGKSDSDQHIRFATDRADNLTRIGESIVSQYGKQSAKAVFVTVAGGEGSHA